MPPIDRLPNEILLYIFEQSVLGNGDTPQRLLRICRRWHAITIGSGSLWCNLHYTTYPLGLIHNQVICTTIPSLAQAVERTKQYKFTLTVSNSPRMLGMEEAGEEWKTVAASVSARCQSLNIIDCVDYFCLPFTGFAALERFKMEGINAESCCHYLSIAESSCSRLEELKLKVHEEMSLKEYPQLISQIPSLSVSLVGGVDTIDYLGDALALEELEILGQLRRPFLLVLESWLPALQSLKLVQGYLSTIRPERFTNLRTLFLDSTRLVCRSPGAYHIPSLFQLTLKGFWNDLNLFDAPNLHSLNLLNLSDPYPLKTGSLFQSNLRPKTVRVDIGRNPNFGEAQVRDMLWKSWSDVTELWIIYTEQTYHLKNPLANAFLGMVGKEPACPNLRSLIVLSPNYGRYTKALMERRTFAEARLQKIAEQRKGNGILESVAYGWYKWLSGEELRGDFEWVHLLGSRTDAVAS